jgi:hypothetical protein
MIDEKRQKMGEYTILSWRKAGNVKLQIAIANTIIFRFDVAQERRLLTPGERWLRRMLKHAVLGLASLERTIARQRSRLRWLKEGDANTKLFHAVANGRRVKNYISAVRVGDELVTDQERKVEVFTKAFSQLLGRIEVRDVGINLQELNIKTADITEFENLFSEEEIWNVVKDLPPGRAPGPDGFIGAFYQRAWPVIKGDIMAGLMKLGVGDGRGFARLNRAIITLIPKRQDAMEIGDYRPISLVHSFSKLFSKILANRLSKRIGEEVSKNQSAFIKKRSLHDNFVLVWQVARKINRSKRSGVLLKLDLARAFDSISWSFLFEVLRRMGFGERFLKWIALLLHTANTKVMVNGMPGGRIYHARGLRQGDPTSPLLFVAGMEVMTALIERAVRDQLLSNLASISPLQRISIFADDVVCFFRPERAELEAIKQILHIFGAALGLKANYCKTTATVIRGSEEEIQCIKTVLGCEIAEFPIKYLGLKLALRPLTRAEWQFLLDKALFCLPAWQRGLIDRAGRLVLIKAVLMARPIH